MIIDNFYIYLTLEYNMPISQYDVEQILKLSKLSANNDELAIFSTDLNKIITFFSSIHTIETDTITPMISPLIQGITSRKDIAKHQNLQSQFSELCPRYEKGHCIVPIVIE